MILFTAIKKWWHGEEIPYENDPNSLVVIFSSEVKLHWSSKIVHAVVDFVQREWKWLIGISFTLVGLAMTYVRWF